MDHEQWLNLCYQLALLSPCAKAKFGSVVVSPEGLEKGRGFNISPNKNYTDCATLCSGGIRKGIKSGTCLELCYAVHAEQWAIIKAENSEGCTIYVAGFNGHGDKLLKDPSLPKDNPDNPNSGFYCSLCSRIIYAADCKQIIMDGVSGPIIFTPDEAWESSYEIAKR